MPRKFPCQCAISENMLAMVGELENSTWHSSAGFQKGEL
jgi:hypothetical protein